MTSTHDRRFHAPTAGKMDNVGGRSSNTCNRAPVDLLDIEMEFTFMSTERQQQLMVASPDNHMPCHFSDDDVLTPGGLQVRGQGQPCVTSRFEQARSRDFQSFDVAPAATRLIKAHRRRQRSHGSAYRRFHDHNSAYADYFDRDAVCSQRDRCDSSRDRDRVLKHRFEAASVAAMADFDARDERDYDRRGTDSYRGGGNKRRRDGELLDSRSMVLQQLTMSR